MTTRILLAIALAILIYGIAIGVLGGLLFVAFSQALRLEPTNLAFGVLALMASLVLAWAIFPRKSEVEPPGILISSSAQPSLFAEIQRVSRDVGIPAPDEVYLTLDAEASVSHRGGLLRRKPRRIMKIGVDLLAILTVSQLRAVVAHECGHFHPGDKRSGFSTYIFVLADTVFNAIGMYFTRIPFGTPATVMVILTANTWRNAEYDADRLAASFYGRDVHADALRKIARMSPAFPVFWELAHEIVVEGFRPPVNAGFGHYIENHSNAYDETLAERMEITRTEQFDTHPPLRDRLMAIGDPEPTNLSGEAAIHLIDDLSSVEDGLIRQLPVRTNEPDLVPVAWEDVEVTVMVPKYREILLDNSTSINGIQVRDIPQKAKDLLEMWDDVPGYEDSTDLSADESGDASKGEALVGMALMSMLVDRGWRVDSSPWDEPHPVLSLGKDSVEPFSVVRALASNDMASDYWVDLAERAGIADMDLAEAKAMHSARTTEHGRIRVDERESETVIKITPGKFLSSVVWPTVILVLVVGLDVGVVWLAVSNWDSAGFFAQAMYLVFGLAAFGITVGAVGSYFS